MFVRIRPCSDSLCKQLPKSFLLISKAWPVIEFCYLVHMVYDQTLKNRMVKVWVSFRKLIEYGAIWVQAWFKFCIWNAVLMSFVLEGWSQTVFSSQAWIHYYHFMSVNLMAWLFSMLLYSPSNVKKQGHKA